MRCLAAFAVFLSACSTTDPIRRAEDRRDRNPANFENRIDDPRAVLAMARIQSPSLAPLLVEALARERSRAIAAWGLGQMVFGEYWDADRAPELAAALRPFVLDDDPEVRARVAVALGRLGEEPLSLLADRDASVRAAAVESLFWRSYLANATLSDDAVQAVIAASAEPDLRWRCAYVFTRVAEPRAREMLERLATDESEWARMFALRAYSKLEDHNDALYEEALGDPSAHVRAEAARLVQNPPSGPERDPDVHVRAAFASRFGLAHEDASAWVRALSIDGMCESMPEQHRAALADLLRERQADPDPRIRAAVARNLWRTAEWRSLFDPAFADEDLGVRLEAVSALGKADEPDARAVPNLIIELLSRDLGSVSLTGAAVDAAAEREDATLAPALMACYERSSGGRFVEVRENIVSALQALEAWDSLESMVDDPAPSVAAKARRALAEHREEDVEEPMVVAEHVGEYVGAPAPERLVLETERGAVVIAFEREWAPTHCAAIASLARNGFYDGLIFHRVVSNFVVQGGDPEGTGWGDAGFQLRDEVSPLPFDRGMVGMAKAGKDTGSCQLFITHTPTPHLNGRYTIFGRVIEGMDVVDRIEVGDRILRAWVE